MKLCPGAPEVYYDLEDTYAAKGEYNNAIEDFSKTIELNPEFTEAYAKRTLGLLPHRRVCVCSSRL